MAYIGWSVVQWELGKHKVSASSLPQYISAVRYMQELLLRNSVLSFPFVNLVIRAYGKWEEEVFPKENVRCGLLSVWCSETGMGVGDVECLRVNCLGM